MISKELSQKMHFFSSGAIVLVVFLHANNYNLLPDSHYMKMVELFICEGICRIAVPIFFMISGYFFFIKFPRKFLWNDYINQVKKRIRSLMVPFLYLSVFGFLCSFGVYRFIPGYYSESFANEFGFASFSLALYRVLWEPRFCYQLWFLRDLFMLVIVSPIIYCYCKSLKNAAIPFLFIFLFITLFFNINLIIFSATSVFYFSIGGTFALRNMPLVNISKSWKFYLLLLFFWLLLCSYQFHFRFLLEIRNCFGIIVLWRCYDCFSFRSNPLLGRLFKFTFAVYLFHEPMLTIIKKMFWCILPHTEISLGLIFFSSSLLSIVLSIIIAIVFQKKNPVIYSTITGNRG